GPTRGAGPATQKRGVEVARRKARYVEHGARNDLAVRNRAQEVRRRPAQAVDRLEVADPLRLIDREPELLRGNLARRWRHLHSAARRPLGLRDYECHSLARLLP